MKSEVKLIEFSDFTKIASGFFKTCGIDAFTTSREYGCLEKSIQYLLFLLGTWNLILTIIGEIIYLKIAFGALDNFLQITALLPCTGVCIGSIAKIMTVWIRRRELKHCMQELANIFPNTAARQKDFHVDKYLEHVPRMIIPCAAISMIAVWVFNLYDLVESVVNYCSGESFAKIYPYFVWYPFDDQINWMYPILYLHQSYAGYVAVGASLAADLFLCCIINQLRMQFDYISRKFKYHVARGKPDDIKKLKGFIKHHIVILGISEKVSDIFALSNFYNFLSSSLIICLVGFQVSAGVSNKVLVKFILFLLYQFVLIFMMCYHGQIVIDASLGIGDAAYNHEWFEADNEYRKLLLFLITRAKRPSQITATSFVVVSLTSFNKIISSSYQFFALVRSMYNKSG